MGYEQLCVLDPFVLLDRITIGSWASYICVSCCLIQVCKQNCYLEQNEPFCRDFLLTQYKLARFIPPSLACVFTFIIKLYCKWLHVCSCMFCCKCFNTSYSFCLGEVVPEVGEKIVLLEANLLKWLFFLSFETAFCLIAVNRWSEWSMASAYKPLTFNFSCKQNTEITG